MPHNDTFGGNSVGWHFSEYMGIAGDPIPCDSEQEVTSQFRVVHRAGDVAGKPIEIELNAEGELPSHMERGECTDERESRSPEPLAFVILYGRGRIRFLGSALHDCSSSSLRAVFQPSRAVLPTAVFIIIYFDQSSPTLSSTTLLQRLHPQSERYVRCTAVCMFIIFCEYVFLLLLISGIVMLNILELIMEIVPNFPTH
jgi:hypothetical protein